jgi:hypothetical protein
VEGCVFGTTEQLLHELLLRRNLNNNRTIAQLDMTSHSRALPEVIVDHRSLAVRLNFNESIHRLAAKTIHGDVDRIVGSADRDVDDLRIVTEEGHNLVLRDDIWDVAHADDTSSGWLSEATSLDEWWVGGDVLDRREKAFLRPLHIPHRWRLHNGADECCRIAANVVGIGAASGRSSGGDDLTTVRATERLVDGLWMTAGAWVAVVTVARIISSTVLDHLSEMMTL